MVKKCKQEELAINRKWSYLVFVEALFINKNVTQLLTGEAKFLHSWWCFHQNPLNFGFTYFV